MSEQLSRMTPTQVADPFHEYGPLPDVPPTDAAHPLHGYATCYPEVARAGSLQKALQDVVDRAGAGFPVELTSSPGWRHVAAQAEADGRSVTVLMGGGERVFIVNCWTQGVAMARGSTQDLTEVAGAMHSWHQGSKVRELVTRWAFLRTWELAEAHERGEAVPGRWKMMRDGAALRHARYARRNEGDWQDLVEAAFEQPRLRVLSPGQSLCWLTFSRRATPPICRDFPRTRPLGDGRFEVTFTDGRVREVDGAAAAVSAILDGLPDDAAPRPADT